MTRTLTSVMLASAAALTFVGCTATQSGTAAGQPACAADQSTCAAARPACGSCACVVPAGAATAVNTATADALRETLMDERLAQTFYNAVMAKHGQVRPFSNIVHAEERHAAVVESLMKRHDVPIPAGMPTNVPAVPATLPECNRLAAQIERENIAMYDRLLKDVTDPDIRTAFVNLRDASKNNHLPAFERFSANAGNSASAGAAAYGYGRGRRVTTP